MNPSLSVAKQLYMEQGIDRLSEMFIKPFKVLDVKYLMTL
jgi:hypothetical protein